jgi:hypothetical protein
MNESRGLFVLDGITGMLIATLLLLGILAGLTWAAIGAQDRNANNFYEIKDAESIKMIDNTSASHMVDVEVK